MRMIIHWQRDLRLAGVIRECLIVVLEEKGKPQTVSSLTVPSPNDIVSMPVNNK